MASKRKLCKCPWCGSLMFPQSERVGPENLNELTPIMFGLPILRLTEKGQYVAPEMDGGLTLVAFTCPECGSTHLFDYELFLKNQRSHQGS